MEALVDEGKLRNIGLQDASVEQLTEMMSSARIFPAVNSVEVHPGNRNDELLAFCKCQVCWDKKFFSVRFMLSDTW